mmetsp:Transcript_112906/g.231032  ORF Transcript_112906/g.231032 Transcript_112906/m.231032 type:complete len:211 (+) Transcript_112906:1720-2352(+)
MLHSVCWSIRTRWKLANTTEQSVFLVCGGNDEPLFLSSSRTGPPLCLLRRGIATPSKAFLIVIETKSRTFCRRLLLDDSLLLLCKGRIATSRINPAIREDFSGDENRKNDESSSSLSASFFSISTSIGNTPFSTALAMRFLFSVVDFSSFFGSIFPSLFKFRSFDASKEHSLISSMEYGGDTSLLVAEILLPSLPDDNTSGKKFDLQIWT